MQAKSVACPKCGRHLPQASEAIIPGCSVIPMYQCDECLVHRDFLGKSMELAVTFCIDANGKPFDPAEPGGMLRLE